MKLPCTLILAAICATASAQTIKTLGFNTTNGQVVANTTNALHFTNDSIAFNAGDLSVSNGAFFWGGQPRWAPEDNSFDSPLAFNGTNTAATTRTNLGLGASNDVAFQGVITKSVSVGSGGSSYFTADINTVEAALPIEFANNSAPATRTNLGIPLAALTNDSNATMMRALAGSTNTNEPFSGIIQYADSPTGDTYEMTVSNGIIIKTEMQ